MEHYALFGIRKGKKELADGNVGGDFIIKENENALPRDELPLKPFILRKVRKMCKPTVTHC